VSQTWTERYPTLTDLCVATMAFDHPLEADRVEDLNFFSAFVRAPVVGTLMWILGGKMAKEEEEKELKQQTKEALMDDSTDEVVPPPSLVRTSSASGQPKKSALKKSQPSLAGSDISDVGECAESLERVHLVEGDSLPKSLRPKRKKELSWSDQNGKGALAQFMDEEVRTKQSFLIFDHWIFEFHGVSEEKRCIFFTVQSRRIAQSDSVLSATICCCCACALLVNLKRHGHHHGQITRISPGLHRGKQSCSRESAWLARLSASSRTVLSKSTMSCFRVSGVEGASSRHCGYSSVFLTTCLHKVMIDSFARPEDHAI